MRGHIGKLLEILVAPFQIFGIFFQLILRLPARLFQLHTVQRKGDIFGDFLK